MKNEFGALTDFKSYLEAEVITTKWYWQIVWGNGIKSRYRLTHAQSVDKCPEAIPRERIVFSTNDAGITGGPYAKIKITSNNISYHIQKLTQNGSQI